MIHKRNSDDNSADLRKRAEEKALRNGFSTPEEILNSSTEEIHQLVHELQVHQIELEMQNEELRRAQAAVEESQARYFDLYDMAPIGYCTLSENGEILEANLTLASLLNTSRDKIIGRPFSENIIAKDQDILYHHRNRLLNTGEPQICELRLTRTGEPPIDTQLNATMITDQAGRRLCRTMVSDITDRIRTEHERREIEEQIQHIQKLESLSVLAGGVAHDFNNLLMAMIGNADLTLDQLTHDSPFRVHIEGIMEAAIQASKLAGQMLAFSGKGHFLIHTLDLSNAVGSMRALLEASVAKEIEIEYGLDSNLPAIEADATQISQVILNLVSNASEAIVSPGGVISIRTSAVGCTAKFLRETWINDTLDGGTYVCLTVSDNGTGMSQEIQTKMFDPFFTTKIVGRGLGLAALMGIVRGHKGAVTIESAPGHGTSISIFFPASKNKVPDKPAISKDRHLRHVSGAVLLIDDEESVRKVAGAMLSSFGFEVLTAEDGQKGIELFNQHAKKITLVLLDLGMPKMSSEEVMILIQRISPETKVILSSGYVEFDVLTRFASKGFAGFIQKPYRIAALKRKINEVL